MDLELAGKVAFVTGSGRGIGEAIARTLAAEGVAVAVVDRDLEPARAVAESLKAGGCKAAAFQCDVTDAGQVRAAVEGTVEALGPIDILVNNAGFNRDRYLTRMSEHEWDGVSDTILKGAFHCCRAVLDGMMARKWGRIINISSRSVFGNPGQTNYSAAKMGLIGFTRALALEQGRFGVTVNAVAPGFIETDGMKANKGYAELREIAVGKNPVGFLGEPQDIAGVVAFIASPRARYMTGTTTFVTGGRYSS